MSDHQDELPVLEATYDRLCKERDRLRDARGFFSRPLGPAPASAGISTALVTTLGSKLDTGFVWAAVGTLALLVLVGIAYDGKPAYRHLYARELAGVRKVRGKRARRRRRAATSVAAPPAGSSAEEARYRTMIAREEAVIGEPALDNRHHWPWFHVSTLQEGLDVERTGLRTVQALWLAVIVLLVLAVLA
jgi:hypothetical protein